MMSDCVGDDAVVERGVTTPGRLRFGFELVA